MGRQHQQALQQRQPRHAAGPAPGNSGDKQMGSCSKAWWHRAPCAPCKLHQHPPPNQPPSHPHLRQNSSTSPGAGAGARRGEPVAPSGRSEIGKPSSSAWKLPGALPGWHRAGGWAEGASPPAAAAACVPCSLCTCRWGEGAVGRAAAPTAVAASPDDWACCSTCCRPRTAPAGRAAAAGWVAAAGCAACRKGAAAAGTAWMVTRCLGCP